MLRLSSNVVPRQTRGGALWALVCSVVVGESGPAFSVRDALALDAKLVPVSVPCRAHNYIGHNYIGHNYVGHNYVRDALALVAKPCGPCLAMPCT